MVATTVVVGGAGYIGSHMVLALAEAGHEVIVLDNLSTGYRSAVRAGRFLQLDITDAAALDGVFASRKVDAVLHFASFIQVGESVSEPGKYYANNVAATLTLLEAMRRHGVGAFIFSSTAAVYGDPDAVPIDEAHPKRPINPYGRSKWMVEQILADYGRAHGLRSLALRYFNAAGADPQGRVGERHEPETHLIPLALQAAAGRRPALTVFGRDYDTPDGTCIRDYVHVCDLADAHRLALEHLLAGGESLALNLGNGQGFSVQEVIDTARRVSGQPIPTQDAPRREGDPARLVADARAARRQLGWQPRHAELETIIAHAWQWERQWPWR